MQDINQEVTDVEFKEIPVEKKEEAQATFNPVSYLTNALNTAGLTEAAAAWVMNIDPRAETAEDEKERIFFANRALRLFLAEQPDRDNITPRMLLADGIDGVKWAALMEQGVIPWLKNEFDKKGKRVKPEANDDGNNPISARSDGDIDDYNQKVASGEIVPADEASIAVPGSEAMADDALDLAAAESPCNVTKEMVGLPSDQAPIIPADPAPGTVEY